MEFMKLLKELENYTSKYDLEDLTVTSNKINGVSFILIKAPTGKIEDCIILHDEKYETKSEYIDLREK